MIWNLTGGKESNGIHISDVTNASRTMLMNLETLEWDPFLCNLYGIPSSILPRFVLVENDVRECCLRHENVDYVTRMLNSRTTECFRSVLRITESILI